MHHTDPSMDSSTAVRFHPVELIISYLFNVIILVLLGLNFAFLIVYKTVMFPVIIFHHSNVAFSEKWGRFLNYLFVMPNMHRVHHSEKMEETNSNYGSIFSFWDRLFGTFRKREDIKSITYGIGPFKSAKWQNIFGMLFVPFR
jgi:sterol desaturase/sphingolipid hydroxylase (fatty acid hydroxylase superfamily)